MLVKFSEMINPLILNSKMVGFHGDSEFVDKHGKLHMGSWTFIGTVHRDETDIIEENYGTWILDDKIYIDEILDKKDFFFVWNSKETILNMIEINYIGDKYDNNN